MHKDVVVDTHICRYRYSSRFTVTEWIVVVKGDAFQSLTRTSSIHTDLAIKIRDKESEANEAVITIRKVEKELMGKMKTITDPALKTSMEEFLKKIDVIENDLYQKKNQSGQDPLNFPIKLNNRLSSLRRSVETGDGKPTDGAYKVFEELTAELEGHLGKLKGLMEGEWEELKTKL